MGTPFKIKRRLGVPPWYVLRVLDRRCLLFDEPGTEFKKTLSMLVRDWILDTTIGIVYWIIVWILVSWCFMIVSNDKTPIRCIIAIVVYIWLPNGKNCLFICLWLVGVLSRLSSILWALLWWYQQYIIINKILHPHLFQVQMHL